MNNVNNTQKNVEKKNKETSRMITREEFEKTRQYGLEKLKSAETARNFKLDRDFGGSNFAVFALGVDS